MIAGGLPGWPDIMETMSLFVAESDRVTTTGRIKIPGAIYVYASTLDEVEKDVFPGTLNILVGHALYFGWHVSMFKALTSGNDAWNASLWQAALTVTMHIVVGKTVEELAAEAMVSMGKSQTAAFTLDESWPTFAPKLVLALRKETGVNQKLAVCAEKGMRFQRTTVHRTMLAAATAYLRGSTASPC